jgi:hypothetical protein
MKLVMVNSHERSGTHFLMNTIALNFGYCSFPYYNMDMPVLPHIPNNMLAVLQQIKEPRHIIKSHYEGTFFRPIINKITKHAHVFYIYREEEGVFKSCLKHWNSLTWEEAARCETVDELKVAQPYGGCMRYQFRQYPSMLARWQGHKASWKEKMGGADIIYVRYDDLSHRFDKTLMIISKRMGIPIIGGIARKPDKSKTVRNGEFNEKEVT